MEDKEFYLFMGLVSFIAHPGSKTMAGKSLDKVLDEYAMIARRATEIYQLRRNSDGRPVGSINSDVGVEDSKAGGSTDGEQGTVSERATCPGGSDRSEASQDAIRQGLMMF